jgi:hypothetical protein
VGGFLCSVYNKDTDSDFGHKLLDELETKFTAFKGLKRKCKVVKIQGINTPTMMVKELERLLFCLKDKTLPAASNISSFNNMLCSDSDHYYPITKEQIRPYQYYPPKVVMPPMDPKVQPVYYKLQLIPDQDLICCFWHTNQDGVTDIYWSIFDYFCIMYEHKTTNTFGSTRLN